MKFRPLRLVPDDTHIRFMRGRFAGLIVSAILSTLSLVLFLYPGLNYSIDFKGGTIIELRMPNATHRGASAPQRLRRPALRASAGGSGIRLAHRFSHPPRSRRSSATMRGKQRFKHALARQVRRAPEIRRLEAVGAKVSGELFRAGLMAVGISFVGVLFYIWFRFDWQFGVGVVGTLLLDITKTVGFFAITRIASLRPQFGRGDHAADRLFSHRQDRGL